MAADHPRIRGEHDIITATGCRPWGSSPHTRGAPERISRWSRRIGIIPAYAGSTRCAGLRSADPPDHPRIRGEHFIESFQIVVAGGSSPHTRGAPGEDFRGHLMRRIIPAYAGSTCYHICIVGLDRDHPRIRGEHFAGDLRYPADDGSSPHTRGAPAGRRHRLIRRRIIPAYAGSTSGLPLAEWRRADHPRIRGEHSGVSMVRRCKYGSSPHTRGAPRRRARRPAPCRIIPAYAGSTHVLAFRQALRRDHPRIRGEHSKPWKPRTRTSGSSPHTRGAHLEIPAIPRIAAVIIPVFLYPSPTPQEEADRSMVLLTLS